MTAWGTTLAADRTRDASHDGDLPTALAVADARYAVPRYDASKMLGLQSVTLRHRNDALFGGTWDGHVDVPTLVVSDNMKPSPGNDMAMVVCQSATGRWVQLWGYAAYLWEQDVYLFGRKVGTIRLYSAGPGARWVASASELRDSAGNPADYREWEGNGRVAGAGGYGPQGEGATLAELNTAMASNGILPRITPCYIPNTGGAVLPCPKLENPDPKPGQVPSGWGWAYDSTDAERQSWAAAKYPPGRLRAAALVYARSLSIAGRGVMATATVPDERNAAFVYSSDDLGLPADLLTGMPGRPVGLAPMVGRLAGGEWSAVVRPCDEIRPT